MDMKTEVFPLLKACEDLKNFYKPSKLQLYLLLDLVQQKHDCDNRLSSFGGNQQIFKSTFKFPDNEDFRSLQRNNAELVKSGAWIPVLARNLESVFESFEAQQNSVYFVDKVIRFNLETADPEWEKQFRSVDNGCGTFS